jgi:hypothetical protein
MEDTDERPQIVVPSGISWPRTAWLASQGQKGKEQSKQKYQKVTVLPQSGGSLQGSISKAELLVALGESLYS